MAVVPGMKTTMSVASPDNAARIRSAVTGALKKDESGLPCFENTVETTFVLPWDLNPQVEPEKLSVKVRDEIRTDLMDELMLRHLEGCGSINWYNTIQWQYSPLVGDVAVRPADGTGNDWSDAGNLSGTLEMSYLSPQKQHSFNVGMVTYQVDHMDQHLLDTYSHKMYCTRRLAMAPLIPLKTETGKCSLFHACSLAFWGIHDRTSLLQEAVQFCLQDVKTQFLFYNRWSQGLDQNKEFPHWEAAKKDAVEGTRLHVFALANIVQRPIIVYSNPGSSIGGVYLPLLWKDTHKKVPCANHPHLRNPIALGYSSENAHFAPLVTFKGPKGPQPLLLPLTHSSRVPLPIHYLTQTEKTGDLTSVLSEAMYIDLIPPQTTPTQSQVLVAISTATELPEVMDRLVKRYESLFL